MPTLRGIPLSPPLLAALKSLVPRIDAVTLKQVARDRPKLFPAIAQNADAIRKQVDYLAGREGELEPWLMELLRTESVWMEVVCVLSERAMEFEQKAWSAYFGAADWTLALLFDDRERVQALGRELAGRLDQVAALTREDAAGVLSGTYGPFLSRLTNLTIAQPVEAETPVAKDDDLKRKLDTAEKRVHQLEKELRAQQERTETARSREALANEELRTAKDRIGGLIKEQHGLEERLKMEREDRERAIAQAAAAETNRLVRSWLAEPMALPPASSASTELLERAGEALRRQSERDRAVGERRAIASRLDALERMRHDVSDALTHALQPLPELAIAARDLADEAARLRGLLKLAPDPDPIADRFLRLADAATGWQEAARLKRLVTELAERDVIPGTTAVEVVRRLQNRVAAALDTAATAQAMRTEDYETARALDPLWHFRVAVDSGAPVRLLIDGHNLALGDMLGDELSETAPVQGVERRLRERLTLLVKRLASRDRRHLTIDLWFDGAATSSQLEDGMTIRFSGGTGRDRADDAIIGSLQATSALTEPVFLATSDRALAARARKAGAVVISAPELLGLLADLPPR